ncbi:MAG: glycogen/starch synthase, partial [Candidatus Binatia bacterium]
MPPANQSAQSRKGEEKKSSGLHIAMIASEVAPFAKSGGLADMVSGLSLALEQLGLTVSVILPAYRSFLRSDFPREESKRAFTVPVSNRTEPATVFKTKFGKGISVYLIRADKYFDRDYL